MALKITVGELYKRLQKEIKEKPWIKDLYITNVDSVSWNDIETGHAPDDYLISLKMSATSSDGNLSTYINFDDKILEIIHKVIKKMEGTKPSSEPYAYFFPSLNKGKRLLIVGWFGPDSAAYIANRILTKEVPIDYYDCVEEIDC